MASLDIPKTMKGVLIEKTGGVDVLQYRTDLPLPVLKDDELLIKNEVIGVNFIDTYVRTGLYPSQLPLIPGQEAAGTVVASGSSSTAQGLEVGTRVVFTSSYAYAEYSAVSASKALPIPSSIDSEIACAAVLQGLTVLTLIDEAYAVKQGDWILVTAAAGGAGGLLCQALKARGARTIGVASTPEKRALAKEYGAEVVCDYADALQTVSEHTGGKGCAAVLDSVGKDTWDMALQAVARKGTVVSYGNASGAVPPFAISRLGEKNVKVLRPRVFGYLAEKEEWDYYSKQLWDMLENGHLKIGIHKVYPLEQAAQAHTDLEGRKTAGKLLLKP